jgi:hypothetical protein
LCGGDNHELFKRSSGGWRRHFSAALSIAVTALSSHASWELSSPANISVFPGLMIQLAGNAISGTIE